MVGSSGKCEPVRILGELHALPTVGRVQRVVRGTSENISFNKQSTILDKCSYSLLLSELIYFEQPW